MILVVEDDFLQNLELQSEIRRAGFTPVSAFNADEAVEVFRGNARIRAVICDIHMPGALDGIALLRTLRQSRPTLPFIFITAYADLIAIPEDVPTFSKPYVAETVMAKLREILN